MAKVSSYMHGHVILCDIVEARRIDSFTSNHPVFAWKVIRPTSDLPTSLVELGALTTNAVVGSEAPRYFRPQAARIEVPPPQGPAEDPDDPTAPVVKHQIVP